jgi:hypothetical protein
MNMWASAKAFTPGELRNAFDEYAAAHGAGLATLALERSTGAREVSAVPDGRILNGMVELVGGYSFVGRRGYAPGQAMARSLAGIHESLAAIGEKAFATLSFRRCH